AFAAYASFGCVCMVFMQSLLNCAVVCGAAPTTGMPLPFFSSGGSSLVVSFCMCGFVINASHAPPDDEGGGMSVLGI
ncbi:MAG: FtsW/RodA/SpoVE family cell cycle protein, partial [Treponema sp.]|nr:FtsW/RodA/SpoVE family cell cycle protein [Treponema sp.]